MDKNFTWQIVFKSAWQNDTVFLLKFKTSHKFFVIVIVEGWRTPLRIPKDAWKKFNPSELMRRSSLESHGIKRKASDSDNMVENKRPR